MVGFQLDYSNDHSMFFLTLNFDKELHDQDDYEQASAMMQRLFLYWNSIVKGWKITDALTTLAWLDYYKCDYTMTKSAVSELLKIQEYYDTKEVKTNRVKIFDESLLQDGFELYNYQREAINWRLKRSAYLDAFSPGLGKTVINTCVVSQLFNDGDMDSLILLVPTGLPYHWKREILQTVTTFTEDDIHIINNGNKIKPFKDLQDKKIIIIPNHLFQDVVLSYKKGYKMGASAKKLRWDVGRFCDLKKEWHKENIGLLIDESHLFKSSDAVRSKTVLYLKKYFKYRFLLSATPAINRIEDIYNQLHIIDRSIIPMPEGQFKLWLAKNIGNRWNRYAITEYNAMNASTLKDSYTKYVAHKLKEDLPEMKTKRITTPIYVNMSKEQYYIYRTIADEELKTLGDEYNGDIPFNKVENKLPYLCGALDNIEILKSRIYDNENLNKAIQRWNIKKDPKFEVLTSKLHEYIEELDEKVIVYDWHPETLTTLTEIFKKYNPLVIHGQLEGVKDKDRDRQEKEDLFNYDPKHKVIFLSALTSSAGINLQKSCRRVIFYTMPWDATLVAQAMDRTFRINSVLDTIVEFITVDKSLDTLRYGRNLNRITLNEGFKTHIPLFQLYKLLGGIV